jgi:outer membrane protein assembly factor BamA
VALALDAAAERAPHTEWFGMGRQSASREEYALTTRSAGARVDLPLPAHINLAGRVAYLDTDASILGSSSWVELAGTAAFDTRTSPGYTRSGTLLSVTIAHLAAGSERFGDFERITLDARQFVPLLHEHWVLAFQARGDFTVDAASAPFFLLPYLGGGSSLRGYSEYRFTDRHSVITRGELRWIAGRTIDVAAFVDQGIIAPEARLLRLADYARGWGLGVRFHGYKSTALRLDVAHSDEGWHLHVGRNVAF